MCTERTEERGDWVGLALGMGGYCGVLIKIENDGLPSLVVYTAVLCMVWEEDKEGLDDYW